MSAVKKNPLSNTFSYFFIFIIRQIYKIIFVFPFQLISALCLSIGGRKVPGVEPAEICFLITSIIYPKEKKAVSFGGIRSIFSPEQRAEQTLQSIASIRAKVPKAKIILIESGASPLLPKGVEQHADQYIYVGDSGLVRYAADSKNKSLGEAVMLLTALPQLHWRAAYYFKMSGRYFLNDDFNLNDWKQDKVVVGRVKDDYYISRLYSFSASLFNKWKRALWLGLPLNLIDYAIENTLAKFLPKQDVVAVEKLGLSGVGATSGDVIKD